MEKVKKAIRLDVSLAPAVTERVVAYQTENEGRSIEIKLFNNGTDYNYTGDGAIYIDKGDGNIIYKALVFENGKADYTLTDNDVAVVGVKIAEIRLNSNTIPADTVIVASQFEIEIRRSIYSENAVESTSEGTAILHAVIEAQLAATNAAESAKKAENAIANIPSGGGGGGNITVDYVYNPESENPQSGIAIAGVIGDIEAALDGIIDIQNSILGLPIAEETDF